MTEMVNGKVKDLYSVRLRLYYSRKTKQKDPCRYLLSVDLHCPDLICAKRRPGDNAASLDTSAAVPSAQRDQSPLPRHGRVSRYEGGHR